MPPSIEPAASADVAQRIGARIRRACLRRGWNAATLAERAGISRTTLYLLESGATDKPRVSTLSKVAAALEIPPESLWSEPGIAELELGRDGPPNDVQRRRRAFDRATNTTVEEVRRERPELFVDWDEADWDELYSEFGTGGRLSREGVVSAAERMNQKRRTVEQLHVVLETHLHDVATNFIAMLYQMVEPSNELATTTQLASLVGPGRLQLPP